MKRPVIFLVGAVVLVLATNCQESTLDQELSDYCECMQSADSDETIQKCRSKIEVIADKYAYDPEASQIIQKRLQECAVIESE